MKNKLLIFAALAVLVVSCKKPQPEVIEGFAFGTYYRVTYISDKPVEGIESQIDSVLKEVNSVYSLFDENSAVSKFNRNEPGLWEFHFAELLDEALRVSEKTDGAFDVTAGPLIRQWGFAKDKEGDVSEAAIDSIMQFVGYEKLQWVPCEGLMKEDPRMQLDFNAIAKGHAVDRVGKLLLKRGIKDFIVDIGGELLTSGVKVRGDEPVPWRVGIQVPTTTKDGAVESDYTFETGQATNSRMAVATSGNYRNYHERDGHRYSHIINPKTGRSEESDLLSVTVVHQVPVMDESGFYCAYVDALATAFMVMGREKAMEYLDHGKGLKNLSAYFIYDENGKYKTEQTANFPARAK